MNLSEIDELTAKLKKKGDITKKEADRLFSPFSRQSTLAMINVKSKSHDPFLCKALKRGIITGKMFDALSKNTAIRNFPIAEFVDFCVLYMDLIIQYNIREYEAKRFPKEDAERLREMK